MRKSLLLISGILLGTFMSNNTSAQVFTEGFEDITTLVTNGWVEQNLSAPIGTGAWSQGTATSPFTPQSGTGFAAVNFQSGAGASNLSNWLMTPNLTFTNGDVITFYTRTTTGSTFADRLQVLLSTNGASSDAGTTAVSVGDFTTNLLDINPTLLPSGFPDTWTQYSITISGLTAATSGRLAFRYFVTNGGPSGANSNYIGIDNFKHIPFGTPVVADVNVSKVVKEYTSIPLSQAGAMPLTATLSNSGTGAATDAILTANVYQLPNVTTPVQTLVSTPVSIVVGGQSMQTAGNFTPTAAGDYLIHYISSCTGNTVTSSDTSKYAFKISDDLYSRDNGQISGQYGIGSGTVGYIGAMYDITNTATLDSVVIALKKFGTDNVAHDGVGDSTRITVFNVAAGLPSTIIGKSPVYVFTPADTGVVVFSTHGIQAIGGGDLVLNPGRYYVAVTEYNTNVGISYSNEIFTNNTYYVGWTGQPFATAESFGASFSKSVVIRPIIYDCIRTTSTATSTICYGDSHTYGDGTVATNVVANESHAYTLPNSLGCDSVITELLVINPSNNLTTTFPICAGESHTYGDGTVITNVTANQTYVYTIQNTTGCDSVFTELVVVTNLNLTVTKVGTTLKSNANGATYQWIDCGNANAPIASATSQTYAPTVNGSYAVIVTSGACSDTSACQTISTISANTIDPTLVQLYPNPTKDVVNVVLKNVENANYIVSTIDGKKVMSGTSSSNTFNVDLSQQANGIYLLTLEQNSLVGTYRLVKE